MERAFPIGLSVRWGYTILLSSAIGIGVAAATRPEGSTAACKDGTYSDLSSKTLACKGHKGVATWYGKQKAATAAKAEPAVQTQSAQVTATGTAPSTGEQSKTPAKP